jgi:YD repeat-containing protein
MSYDANGNLTRLIDPNGNVTQYQYDALDRVTTDTNALNNSQTYRYDAVGNLSQSRSLG